ncbi:uncharacterized protein METZ01_LOCUS407812 [marine metagenome]|uniref:Uncharacterized protein n=1 Tax=marine metagenome TaxID=408172 RepID=A0A382WA05_9ZZZZ
MNDIPRKVKIKIGNKNQFDIQMAIFLIHSTDTPENNMLYEHKFLYNFDYYN